MNVFAFAQKTELSPLRYFMQGNSVASLIPYGNNLSIGKYIQSYDTKIYYEVYGKGKPIVILHGGMVGSPLEMGRFIDSLSHKYQVIAISTRGHGRSEMGSKIPSYKQKAKDVKTVINKMTSEKVTILGFSDGAYTGYFFAELYPDKIEKRIAIGAGEWKKGFRIFKNDSKTFSGMDELYWKQPLEWFKN